MHISVVSACTSDICQCHCSYYPFVLWCLVGYCEPLPEMVKGVMHRARDALPTPLTSLRRGWMELPDVGDFCLVVILKWMNHIMYVVPQRPLCFWYDIQSFAYEFIFMLWIKMECMLSQKWHTSLYLLFGSLVILWSVSYVIVMLSNTLTPLIYTEMLQVPFDTCLNAYFANEMLQFPFSYCYV